MRIPVLVVAMFATIFAMITLAPRSFAQSIIVTELNDEFVVDGDCSLREAIVAANTNRAQDACRAGSGVDTIVLPAGIISVSFPGLRNEDAAMSGDLDILEGVTIQGQGAGVTIIDGSNAIGMGDGLFDVRAGTSTISGVTMRRIEPSLGWNGAIFVQNGASLTMTRSQVLNGASVSSSAGAIWVNGSMDIYDSTISGNRSEFSGGGIYVNFGVLGIYSSVINNNTAYEAGGIYANNSNVTIQNSTISGNTSTSGASGITVKDFGNSNVRLIHVTSANNTIVNAGSTPVTYTGSILGGAVSGPVSSGGYNIVSTGTGFTATGDRVGVSAQLGALQNNGGPTLTHAIASGSAARDSRPSCSIAKDQRGVSRSDGRCDSGAFEFGGGTSSTLVVSITNPASGSSFPQGSTVSFTGTATDTEDGNISNNITWSSNLGGGLGTGSSVSAVLGVGVHTITARIVDSSGAQDTDQIAVTVTGSGSSTMFVDLIETGTASATRGAIQGTATVTIRDTNGNPISGAIVTGNFSGTFAESGRSSTPTDVNGRATLNTNGTEKTKDAVVDFCVTGVAGSLSYNAANNSSPGYACSGGSDPATSVHLAAVATGQQNASKGQKSGTATVTVVDNHGNPASGVSITGTFGGEFNESAGPGTTASDGTVTFVTDASTKGSFTFSFCVASVSHPTLPYEPGDDESPGYSCISAKSSFATFTSVTEVSGFELEQNFPNPFDGVTNIAFSIDEAGPVVLTVYNALGQEVAALVDGVLPAGRHHVVFDASALTAGIYIYSIRAGGSSNSRSFSLVR